MVGLVPTPADRADYYPDPFGVRALSWSNMQGATGVIAELALQDVYDWPTLLFQADAGGAPANAGVYTVSWWHDAAGTLPAGTDQIVVSPSTGVKVALPVRGPRVSVTSASITGAGSHVSGGRWSVTSAPATVMMLPELLVGTVGTTVGAGATLTVAAPRTVTGRAHLIASMPGNAAQYHCDVFATDPTGGSNILARVYGGGAVAVSDSFLIPPWPVNVQFVNTDTAAHAGVFSVTVAT